MLNAARSWAEGVNHGESNGAIWTEDRDQIGQLGIFHRLLQVPKAVAGFPEAIHNVSRGSFCQLALL